MREIVLDTETTGLDPAKGDRIVEIGAVELVNHLATGKTFHAYINPERDVPPEAEAVHGLSTAFLKGKPVFAAIAEEFLAFIGGDMLVIHNASFDTGFLNAELDYLGHPPILPERVLDTLQIARRKHPMGPNSLDALCKRYGVDNSKRTKHGALLDSELLAEVYLELIGGKQTTFGLTAAVRQQKTVETARLSATTRPRPLPQRLTAEERLAHEKFVASLGPDAVWSKLPG
jgi:DNA polymerase III subunit epsilon